MKKSDIFEQKPNGHIVHSALIWFLASLRRGTHSALTRAEVRGGGKKPWKQKGTGRARAGSIRSPLWRKGGVIFGPKPRDYTFSFPKKMRKLALKVALSDKAREGKVKIVDGLAVDQPKTKLGVKLFKELGISGKVLVLVGQENKNVVKAVRNIAGVKLLEPKELNIYELLKAEWVLVEKSGVTQLEEVLA